MRSRNIKPGFFKNEYLAECQPFSRILFCGLWCMADREGRLEERIKRIHIEILPYDDACDIETLMAELSKHGFILRYECFGKKYIQIENFLTHQSPHHKEAPSIIPPPDGHEDSGYSQYKLSEPERAAIFERDSYKCQKCGSNHNLHIDHITPLSKGGSNDVDNLQTLCGRCNSQKGNRNSNDYRKHEASLGQA